jgi:hypothetical protein
MMHKSTIAAAAQPPAARHRRPASVRVTYGLRVFLGLSGIYGGIGLIFGIWGMQLIPREPLDRIPVIDSWLIPGPVLGIGFGLGSLTAAYGILRKPRWPWLNFAQRPTGRHWSWAATILLGLGQIVWILIEWVYVGISPLLVIYGAVGTASWSCPSRRRCAAI